MSSIVWSYFFVLFASFYYRWHPHYWAYFSCITGFSLFFFPIRFVGLMVHPCICDFRFPSRLLSQFSPPLGLCIPIGGINILVFSWDFFSFTYSFLQDALTNDVDYIHALPRLGDVKVAFEIFIHCFTQRFYYFLRHPHTPKFLVPASLLWFNLHSHFWEALKVKFFGVFKSSPKSSASFFLVFRGGINFVSTKVIAMIT